MAACAGQKTGRRRGRGHYGHPRVFTGDGPRTMACMHVPSSIQSPMADSTGLGGSVQHGLSAAGCIRLLALRRAVCGGIRAACLA